MGLGSLSVQISSRSGAMGYARLLLVIAAGVVGAEEVATTTTTTTTTTTAATSAVVNINDACSNGCIDDDPSYWCGMNKKDADGRVVRCVERTASGGTNAQYLAALPTMRSVLTAALVGGRIITGATPVRWRRISGTTARPGGV